MMGSSVQTVERLQKITMRVLLFGSVTTHLLLDGWSRRYFFPQCTKWEPRPALHCVVTLCTDRFAQRTFDDVIQSTCRALPAAQYLSDSYAAYDFVPRRRIRRM